MCVCVCLVACFCLVLHPDHRFPLFSTPSSPTFPLPTLSIPPPFLYRKGKASYGYEPAMVYKVAVRLGTFSSIMAGWSNLIGEKNLQSNLISCCPNCVSSYNHFPFYVKKTLFSYNYPHYLVLSLFLPPLMQGSQSFGRCRWGIDVPIKTGNSIVSYSLSFGKLWAFLLIVD